MDNLDKVLEGILFLSGDGIDKGQIMEKLQVTPKQLEKAIEQLKKRYDENCGINFITYKDKLQLCTNPKFADDVSVVLNPIRERSLTRATLEVMAIVAYKQPVTRIDVQDIRGLNSDYALQTLLNYKLIEVVGRKDAVGKPLLFGTTDLFLRHFGIDDLNQLPDYEEIMSEIEQIERTSHLYNEFDIPMDDEAEQTTENLNFEQTKTKEQTTSKIETINPEIVANDNQEELKNIDNSADLKQSTTPNTTEESTLPKDIEMLKNEEINQQKPDEKLDYIETNFEQQNESESLSGIDYSLLDEIDDIEK